MRSSRFVLLALAAVALAGCMQTGGSGIFARNAPPLSQQQLVMPAMLRPAPSGAAQPVAQPSSAAGHAAADERRKPIAQPV